MDEERMRDLYRRWMDPLPPAGGKDVLWLRILEELNRAGPQAACPTVRTDSLREEEAT